MSLPTLKVSNVVSRPNIALMFAKQSYSSIPEQIHRFLAGIIVAGGNNSKWKRNTLLGPNEKFPFPGDVRCNLVQRLPPSPNQPTATASANKEAPEQSKSDSAFTSTHSPGNGQCVAMTLAEFNRRYLNNTRAANYKPTKFTEELKSSRKLELKISACPRLLQRELRQIFVDMDFGNRALTILSLTDKTELESEATSSKYDVELSKIQHSSTFIETAAFICERLRFGGYWADFVCPTTGRPYLGRFMHDSLSACASKYEQLGFDIQKIGDCNVIENVPCERAFIGTIFTDAPPASTILEKIAKKIG